MDSDSNPNVHAPLLSSFCEITFASRQEALFFLESHNFDLDAAVSSFLDDDNAHHNIIGGTNVGAGDNALPSPADFQHSPSPMPSQPPIDPLSRTTAQGMAPEIPSGGGAGGIRTFSDLKRPAPDSLGYDSDEPQEHNSGDDPKRYRIFLSLWFVYLFFFVFWEFSRVFFFLKSFFFSLIKTYV